MPSIGAFCRQRYLGGASKRGEDVQGILARRPVKVGLVLALLAILGWSVSPAVVTAEATPCDSELRHKIRLIHHRPGELTNQELRHIQNLKDRIHDNDCNGDDDNGDDEDGDRSGGTQGGSDQGGADGGADGGAQGGADGGADGGAQGGSDQGGAQGGADGGAQGGAQGGADGGAQGGSDQGGAD